MTLLKDIQLGKHDADSDNESADGELFNMVSFVAANSFANSVLQDIADNGQCPFDWLAGNLSETESQIARIFFPRIQEGICLVTESPLQSESHRCEEALGSVTHKNDRAFFPFQKISLDDIMACKKEQSGARWKADPGYGRDGPGSPKGWCLVRYRMGLGKAKQLGKFLHIVLCDCVGRGATYSTKRGQS